MDDRTSDDPGPRIPLRDGFVPPWQDMTTLCRHISCSPATVESWVAQGILPPPRKRGSEFMWKWSEVDDYLTHGGHQAAEIDRIREATRRIVEETAKPRTSASDNQPVPVPKPQELPPDVQARLDDATASRTLFVTDAELIRRLGLPEEIAQPMLAEAEEKHGLPGKRQIWGDRRYWPAVKAWLDRTCSAEPAEPRPRRSRRSKTR
jgi:hypothetical protein